MGKKQRNQDKKAEKAKRSEERSEQARIGSQIGQTQALLDELESIPANDIHALHATLSRHASLQIDHLYPGVVNRVQELHDFERSMRSLEENTEPTQEEVAEMQALLKQMGFKKHRRPLCRVCMLVPATKVCCEGARYCGAECSKKDWPNHRTSCTNPQKLQQREQSLMQRMQSLTFMPAEEAIASAREEAEKQFTGEGYEDLD